jgi:hypothetical protein
LTLPGIHRLPGGESVAGAALTVVAEPELGELVAQQRLDALTRVVWTLPEIAFSRRLML